MAQPTDITLGTVKTTGKAIRSLRWYICGLLFLVTLINYVDRQTMGVLNPILKKEIGWDDAGFGWINFSFTLSYAIMFGLSGRILDRIGVRAGLIWAVVVWSAAAMCHSFAHSVLGFAVARFTLGLGESANFPACIKATAEWFPRKERALATGVFNSGATIAVMLSPIIVLLANKGGWRAAFVLSGALGFTWVAVWAFFYRSPEVHPNLDEGERAFILSDKDASNTSVQVPWTSLLRHRQAWAFALGKMMSDPVWWFYLFWLPTYLTKEHSVSALDAATMLLLPYGTAGVGSIVGGWLSSYLIKRGATVARGRLTAMGIFAFCMPAAMAAAWTTNVYAALVLISIATGAHQAWSANLFTLASDTFPKKVVGSIVGLGGMAGAVGVMFMTLGVGSLLQVTHNYVPIFIGAGLLHPLAFLTILMLIGRDFRQAEIEGEGALAASSSLRLAGGIVATFGALLVAGMAWGWSSLAARSVSTAAQGVVASVGVALLGLALLYASRGRAAAG
jgi:ACS family hexuronate transporter-like MFS transporter